MKNSSARSLHFFTFLISIVITLALSQGSVNAFATTEDKIVYAYLPADTVLYRAQTSGYSPITTLPKTYFVAILSDASDEYFNVSYLDLTGFVQKTAVEVCDYEPVTKYALLSATTNNDGLGVNLRDLPDHKNGKILQTIPSGSVLTLYGSCSGTALIPAVGDAWHYVKYTNDTLSTYGYVYSSHVLSDTAKNNVIEKMPDNSNMTPTEIIPSPPKFTTPMQIIFIIALSVPAVIIMLIIFKRKPSKPPHTPRHSD